MDLAGPRLGDPAARRDGAHEGERNRCGGNPPEDTVLESGDAGTGHLSPLCLGAEGQVPSAVLRSRYRPGCPEIFGCQIAWTLLRHGHARPITRPTKRLRGGGFRGDM